MSGERRTQPTTKELLAQLVSEVAQLKERVAELDTALQQEKHPNQTHEAWLEEETDTGTGVFMVPDLQSGSETATSKVLVPGLSYGQCARRGRRSMAFQWVPDTIATYEELLEQTASCRVSEK